MAKFRNVSPLGALDVPALGQIIEAGAEFEVPAELVEFFDGQDENFEPIFSEAELKEREKAAAKRATEEAAAAAAVEEAAAAAAVEAEAAGAAKTEGAQ